MELHRIWRRGEEKYAKIKAGGCDSFVPKPEEREGTAMRWKDLNDN
jgi:hypothetical protein